MTSKFNATISKERAHCYMLSVDHCWLPWRPVILLCSTACLTMEDITSGDGMVGSGVVPSEEETFLWVVLGDSFKAPLVLLGSHDTQCTISRTELITPVIGNFELLPSDHTQGGVTPIDSIVTAATADQNFDRLFSAVRLLTTLIFGHWPLTAQIFCPQRSLDIWTATQVREPVC